jgi:uncharacterized membrane-anchored protein
MLRAEHVTAALLALSAAALFSSVKEFTPAPFSVQLLSTTMLFAVSCSSEMLLTHFYISIDGLNQRKKAATTTVSQIAAVAVAGQVAAHSAAGQIAIKTAAWWAPNNSMVQIQG